MPPSECEREKTLYGFFAGGFEDEYDYLPLITSEEEDGQWVLIAAVIVTAFLDALGNGMTGRNREELVASAWAFLESTMFWRDLELVGFFVAVDVFLRELRELSRNGE